MDIRTKDSTDLLGLHTLYGVLARRISLHAMIQSNTDLHANANPDIFFCISTRGENLALVRAQTY